MFRAKTLPMDQTRIAGDVAKGVPVTWRKLADVRRRFSGRLISIHRKIFPCRDSHWNYHTHDRDFGGKSNPATPPHLQIGPQRVLIASALKSPEPIPSLTDARFICGRDLRESEVPHVLARQPLLLIETSYHPYCENCILTTFHSQRSIDLQETQIPA